MASFRVSEMVRPCYYERRCRELCRPVGRQWLIAVKVHALSILIHDLLLLGMPLLALLLNMLLLEAGILRG